MLNFNMTLNLTDGFIFYFFIMMFIMLFIMTMFARTEVICVFLLLGSALCIEQRLMENVGNNRAGTGMWEIEEEEAISDPVSTDLWDTQEEQTYREPVKQSNWESTKLQAVEDPLSRSQRDAKEQANIAAIRRALSDIQRRQGQHNRVRKRIRKIREQTYGDPERRRKWGTTRQVYSARRSSREAKIQHEHSGPEGRIVCQAVEDCVNNTIRGTNLCPERGERAVIEPEPTARACGRCNSRPSCCGGGGGSCNSNRICCTDAVNCDSTGASGPSFRQKTTQLAYDSACEAQAASDAQQCAGMQAAYQVRAQLAEKACQASNAAQAALAGKQAVVEALQEQISDAEAVLQEQLKALCNLENTAQMACQLVCDSQIQVRVLSSAYQNAQSYMQQTAMLVQAMQQVKEEKEVLIACIQSQIEMLLCQLSRARQELDCTCQAAKVAACSAKQAQENAQRCRKRTAPVEAESAGAFANKDGYDPTAEFEHRDYGEGEADTQDAECGCAPVVRASCGSSFGGGSGGCGSGCGGSGGCGSRCGGSGGCGSSCGGGICGGSRCETVNCEICGANSPENRAQLTQSAQCAAQEAEAASLSQIPAGKQASFQVRTQLAEKACQLSNAAQAALAGKQATVDHLEGEIRDAEELLEAELSTFHIVECTLDMATQEACVAVKQLQTIGCTLRVAKASVVAMTEISCQVDMLRDQKAMLIEVAKRQIEQLLCQLNEARQDMEQTCGAAKLAAAAALRAQQCTGRGCNGGSCTGGSCNGGG